MAVVLHSEVPVEQTEGGADYRTLVGDRQGSTPIRIGIQTSVPGYRTQLHSHPYLEVITILEGEGEAWIEGDDELIRLRPGITLVIPPNVLHWFGVTGDQVLRTYGVHASPQRIVHTYERNGVSQSVCPGRI